MIRWLCALSLLVLPASCSSSQSNTLTGSESQVYDLTFNSVTISLQMSYVRVTYVGSSGDPAILTVNIADITDPSNSTIYLTMLVGSQLRGDLQNLNGGGCGNTTQLMIARGTVVFDQVPKVGETLSGQFNATLTDGYTLDGTFSEKVVAATISAP